MVLAITCGSPPYIPESTVTVQENETRIGSIATYRCGEGFLAQQSGFRLSYVKVFNFTCETDYGTMVGKWYGSYTCVGKSFSGNTNDLIIIIMITT